MIRAILIFFLIFSFAGNAGAFELNRYQQTYLQEQVKLSVNNLFSSIAEENYADVLYDLGTLKSKSVIKRPDFAERMNLGKWKLDKGMSKIEKVEIALFTFAIVHVDLTFKFKANPNKTANVKLIMRTFYEKQKDSYFWAFDLLEVLRLPYLV